jgi:hypothetical protein
MLQGIKIVGGIPFIATNEHPRLIGKRSESAQAKFAWRLI